MNAFHCPRCGELACRDLNVLDYSGHRQNHRCEHCRALLTRTFTPASGWSPWAVRRDADANYADE